MKPVTMILQNLKHAKVRFQQEKLNGVQTIDELKEMLYSHARNLNASQTPKRDSLDARKKEDSLLTVIVPLSSDPNVRVEMSDPQEKIRIGKLFEWIDTVASCSALMMNRSDLSSRNFDIGTLPRIFTTDRFHQSDLISSRALSPFEDIILESKVSWTNATQTEVTIQVKQKEEDLLIARVVLSSVDPLDTTKAAPSSQLEVAGAYQTFLHSKREKVNNSPPLDPPVSHLKFPQNGGVPMSSTSIQHTVTTQLDSGTPSGTVSGGYLIRNALETAEVCAKVFSSGVPCSVSAIVDSKLHKAVPLGSVLKFNSYVANVNLNEKTTALQIATDVDLFANGQFESIGSFLFSLETAEKQPLPQVTPQNIEELLVQYKARNAGNKPKVISTSCF